MHNYSFIVILLLLLTPALATGQSVAKAPVSSNDYYFRALARHNAGDSNGAIADFSKSIELDEAELAVEATDKVEARLAGAYYQRGRVKIKQQDLDGAQADFDRALALNPEYISAYEQRALVRQRKNDVAGAEADREQARSLTNAKSKKASSSASHATTATDTDEALAQDGSIPPNSKIYVAVEDKLGEYLIAALGKKKVPLVIVADRASADFELRGGYAGGAGRWTVVGAGMIFLPAKVYDDVTGHISVINLRTGYRVWREAEEVAGGWGDGPQKRLANALVGALKKKLAAEQKAKGVQPKGI